MMITSLCYVRQSIINEREQFCFCPVLLFLQSVSDYKWSYSLNLYETSVWINLQINTFLALHAKHFSKSLYIKIQKAVRMTVGCGCTIFQFHYNYHHRYRFNLLHYSLLLQPMAQAIRFLMLHIFHKLSTVLYGFDLFNIL